MKKVYIDFEMNMPISKCRKDILNADLIAIGAVMYDEITKETNTFKSLIKTINNQEIYEHIQELTGINDKDMENAPTYEQVMREFKKWLGNLNNIKGIYTFGNLDLTCFTHTDRRSAQKYNHPRFITNIKDMFIDLKDKYMSHGIKCINYISLKNLLEYANIEFNGHVHDPLDDAYNLLVLDKVLSEDKDLQELFIIKDSIKPPFTDINPEIESYFESYRKALNENNVQNELNELSIEILKTFRDYLVSIKNIDINSIDDLRDVNRKVNVFDKIKDIDKGYFDLLIDVYWDMVELIEDLLLYKLNYEEYQFQLQRIIDWYEEDMKSENINIRQYLQESC